MLVKRKKKKKKNGKKREKIATSGKRVDGATAPLRGVFPLDHKHECEEAKEAHFKCLEKSGGSAPACSETAKAYLACRMNKSLMIADTPEALGFTGRAPVVTEETKRERRAEEERRERAKRGYVAGVAHARRRLEEEKKD